MYIWSYTLKEAMVSMMITKKVVGFSCGRVTFQKICHLLAPSSSAASSNSGLVPCRPAR